jgi:hypothetical protein
LQNGAALPHFRMPDVSARRAGDADADDTDDLVAAVISQASAAAVAAAAASAAASAEHASAVGRGGRSRGRGRSRDERATRTRSASTGSGSRQSLSASGARGHAAASLAATPAARTGHARPPASAPHAGAASSSRTRSHSASASNQRGAARPPRPSSASGRRAAAQAPASRPPVPGSRRQLSDVLAAAGVGGARDKPLQVGDASLDEWVGSARALDGRRARTAGRSDDAGDRRRSSVQSDGELSAWARVQASPSSPSSAAAVRGAAAAAAGSASSPASRRLAAPASSIDSGSALGTSAVAASVASSDFVVMHRADAGLGLAGLQHAVGALGSASLPITYPGAVGPVGGVGTAALLPPRASDAQQLYHSQQASFSSSHGEHPANMSTWSAPVPAGGAAWQEELRAQDDARRERERKLQGV